VPPYCGCGWQNTSVLRGVSGASHRASRRMPSAVVIWAFDEGNRTIEGTVASADQGGLLVSAGHYPRDPQMEEPLCTTL